MQGEALLEDQGLFRLERFLVGDEEFASWFEPRDSTKEKARAQPWTWISVFIERGELNGVYDLVPTYIGWDEKRPDQGLPSSGKTVLEMVKYNQALTRDAAIRAKQETMIQFLTKRVPVIGDLPVRDFHPAVLPTNNG